MRACQPDYQLRFYIANDVQLVREKETITDRSFRHRCYRSSLPLKSSRLLRRCSLCLAVQNNWLLATLKQAFEITTENPYVRLR